MVSVNPIRIFGNWRSGYALDRHTVSSAPTGRDAAGHKTFDTTRTEMGELLYRLKYRADKSVVDDIVAAAAAFVSSRRARFDLVVPVPPSGTRAVQPVILLAKGLGKALGLPVAACVTTTRRATPLKGVTDAGKRQEFLRGLYAVDRAVTAGKTILLFDDLYRSGATMNAMTDLLLGQGGAANVFVLTITRTREEPVSTVFIGGSRQLSKLPAEVKARLDNIVAKDLPVVVGDANGADRAVQEYLLDADYRNVTVFCAGDSCRNNLGDWRTQHVAAPSRLKGFQFYAAKDRAMARAADVGLMIWDGQSAGTILNVLRLIRADKKAVVFNTLDRQVTTFKTAQQWDDFLSRCEPALRAALRERATDEEWTPPRQPAMPELAIEEAAVPWTTAQGARSDDDLRADINAALVAGDLPAVIAALGGMARTRGMTQVAKDAGLARESLYRSLAAGGNPEFATILKVMAALGLRMLVTKGPVARTSAVES